ncbi:MAG: flagellar motor rotation protein MotB [Bacteroidetes bacterium]|jgi:chemotaxis protein MotB|nr:flagellar motor rotation protein MotB [Bacteroidota bacterium]
MKKIICFTAAVSLLLSACVSRKKYRILESERNSLNLSSKNCNDELKNEKALTADLTNKNKALYAQVEDLKARSNQMLTTLQDMSVLSAKQAESIKQSLDNISEKDVYIRNLQTALKHKDSLNMALVMNLKKNLDDINDKDVNIKVDKGVVFIDISDKMLFNSGKYTVTSDAKKVLGKVAKVLNTYPDIEFTVEGHTDTIPIRTEVVADNWDLSVKRATAVVRLLQKEYNISPARMTASGHGQYAPIAPNNSEEGRSINRRTRIIILPQLDQFFKLMVQN